MNRGNPPRIAWAGCIAICVGLALVGLAETIVGSLAGGQLIRPASFATNPNVLVIVMLGGVLLALQSSHHWLAVFCGAVGLLTQSRMGYLAALAALAVVVDWRRIPWPLIAGPALAMVAVIVWRTTAADSLVWYRLELWRLTWGQFVSHPLTGVGGSALAQYLATHDSVRPEPIHAHNLGMQVLGAWGLIGAVAGIVIAGGAACFAAAGPDRYGLAYLVGILVDGLGDYLFWVAPMTALMMLIFVLLCWPRRSSASSDMGVGTRASSVKLDDM